MEPRRIRLFVGASVPRDHLESVDDVVAPFKAKAVNARWMELDNQHVTLKFLGATPEDRLGDVAKVCEMVAGGHEPAPLTLSGIGAFPSSTRVRVLWVGLDDRADLLASLASDLDQGFEALGFPTEGRSYTPHLTLCRFKIPVPLKGGLPHVDLSDLPAFEVDELKLYRSHLYPSGARYEVIRRFPLGPRIISGDG